MNTKDSSIEKLMNAAMDCILKKGYNATSINDIVQAAGIPKGSFYYYFESKECFVNDLLFRYAEAKQNELSVYITDQSVSPLNRLRLMLANTAQKLKADQYQTGCLILKMGNEIADSSPKIQHTLSEIYETWVHLHLGLFQEAQAEGEISMDEDLQALAESYLIMFFGTIANTKLTHTLKGFKRFHWVFFENLGRPKHRLSEEIEAYLQFEEIIDPKDALLAGQS